MSEAITLPTLTPVDQAEYDALVTGTALLARPSADVLCLSDADRHDFLQRMTTNNITALRPGQSAVTVLTSPTARVLYVFTVIARDDDLLLLPAPAQTAALAKHLRGQIFFMDKVKVEDQSAAWVRLRVMGPQAAKTLAAINVDVTALPADGVALHDDLIVVAQPHYEVSGFELVVPAERADALGEQLVDAGAHTIGDAAYTARRVELGRPAAGAELVEDNNPLEAGLAWACAENKGCYTGQEIIARQITYDKVTKTLVGLHLDAAVTPGSDVTVEGRSVGAVTTVAYSPALDAPLALAIIKRPHNSPGTAVQVGERRATVAALPFENVK